MTVPAVMAVAFAAFPPALRTLVEAELAAGNSITELSGGFPAPTASTRGTFAMVSPSPGSR